MATRFIQEATQQYAPAFGQQISALQSQVPAIQQLYSILNQGLQGQQQVGNQNILEGASAKGILKSTIPVDQQTGLGQQILQQKGTLAAQQAKEVGGIYSQIGGLQADQAAAIAQLANALQQAFTQQQEFDFARGHADREFALQQQLGDRQYQLALQAARKGYR